jgi:putative ABC transport system ATP-binding protein
MGGQGYNEMIELHKITKVYGSGKAALEVLKGVDLAIGRGEMVAIMGPSGSGKSTLLNIIGCLDQPTAGSYLLEGREVGRLGGTELARVRGQKLGFVFQSFNLLPRLSALANVEMGLQYAGAGDFRQARQALEAVGLGDRARHRPTELSGGEQQRVSIARAIAKKPALILADEPTGNLDSHANKEIMSILTGLNRQQGMTLVMVTHDRNVALTCQRIINIQDGQVVKEEKL